MREMVLVILYDRKRNAILLADVKRGFSKGKFNGPGGKVEQGESPEAAAVRETREEFGIAIAEHDLTLITENFFYFGTHPEWNIHAHVFLAEHWNGEPHETEEMSQPQWFSIPNLPFERMWQDDPLWLPRALAGERLKGEFWFGDDNERIEKHRILPL